MSTSREGVSKRSLKLMKGPLSYIGMFFRAQKEGLWDESNKQGWIPLVVAENKLNNAAVQARLEEVTTFPPMIMNYANMKGIPQLQAALAKVMQHTFVPNVHLDPQHFCVSSGCSSILDNLFFCIADEGEGVLILAPYYPAFDNDLQAKCHLHPLPFYLEEESGAASVAEQLDAAVAQAAAQGIAVRGLLVTNPNNPLGTIYRQETVEGMLRWCLEHKVHYVSDEIYALSVYKGAPFVSALSVAAQLVAQGSCSSTAVAAAGPGAPTDVAAAADGSAVAASGGITQADVSTYVHLVWGMSKDLCGSGLRVGVLYSENARLQQALNSVVVFGSVSNHTQHALSELLADLDWVDGFVAQNQRSLGASYDLLTSGLEQAGIPFKQAGRMAGMFVWVDLRPWLAAPGGWEAEYALWQDICERCHVILTPGKDCHAAEPGFFRLCFAWVPPEALGDAVERLGGYLEKRHEAAATAAPAAA